MASNHPNTSNSHQNAINSAVHGMQTITPPNFHSNRYPDSDSEDEDYSSPIHICIETPLNVRGNNNLVAVNPSEIAKQISISMVSALTSLCEGGSVPMIDEHGAPRPVKFEIKAEVNVDGARNVVGETAVLEAVVDGKMHKPKITADIAIDPIISLDSEYRKPMAGQAKTRLTAKVREEEQVNGLDKSLANGLESEQESYQASDHAKGQIGNKVASQGLENRRKREHSPPKQIDDAECDDDALLSTINTKRARLQ